MADEEEYDDEEEFDPEGEDIRLTESGVFRVTREEFLEELWDYEPGQHVTILAPTQSGKTYLAYQLLRESATVEDPAIVFVMKPRDATVVKWSRENNFRIVKTWPPLPSVTKTWKQEKERGWVLWPRFTMDPDRDNAEMKVQFRRAIMDSYKGGNRILFCDETYSLVEELPNGGLREELITVWTKGSSMDCAMWAASQRPAYVPMWAYSMATHLFIARETDAQARKRYREISGMDPKLVEATIMELEEYEFLYINTRQKSMCVVEAS